MAKITPKDWQRHQHYKDRSPPWIKLHTDLLDDFVFQRLPLASKALAPMLWLLASRTKDAEIDASPEVLAFKLRMNVSDVIDGLKPLIECGLFVDASGVLADCFQNAIPETETERETETEGKKTAPPKTGDGACTFPTFLMRCKEQGTTPVPPEDPIFAYATDAGIPDDWLRMCWACFRERYAEAAKKYAGVKGWRSAFRNSVRQSWFELWWHDGNEYKLTSKGQQAMAVLKSRESKQPEAE